MRMCGKMWICADWRKLQHCLLAVVIVLPSVLCRDRCPADVMQETGQCLATYTSHAHSTADGGAFYLGIDVENIRSVCTALKMAMRCVIGIKDSCPDSSHSQIMTMVDGPLINMYELCHVERIYELYSRHQFCYSKIESNSRICSDMFAASTAHLEERLARGDPRGQKEYCKYFEHLTRCVESNVRRNCGDEAATLTEKLVRASHGPSQACEEEPASTAQPETTLGHVGRTGADESEQQGARVYGAAGCTPRLSLPAAAVLLLASLVCASLNS